MPRIVTLDLFDSGNRFIDVPEWQDAFADRKHRTETRVLNHNGTSGCQIAGCSFTEPAGLPDDVSVFRHTPLRLRGLGVFAHAIDGRTHLNRIDEAPTVA